jgi:hypothetical protein
VFVSTRGQRKLRLKDVSNALSPPRIMIGNLSKKADSSVCPRCNRLTIGEKRKKREKGGILDRKMSGELILARIRGIGDTLLVEGLLLFGEEAEEEVGRRYQRTLEAQMNRQQTRESGNHRRDH